MAAYWGAVEDGVGYFAEGDGSLSVWGEGGLAAREGQREQGFRL